MAAELTMFVSKQKGWNIIVLVLTSLFLSLRNRTKTQPYPNSHFGPDNKPAAVNNPRAHHSEPSSLRGSVMLGQCRHQVPPHWTVSDIFNDIMR